jgi:kynureninase
MMMMTRWRRYLNAGPGGIGGFFVHQRHAIACPPLPRLAGWWGRRFLRGICVGCVD